MEEKPITLKRKSKTLWMASRDGVDGYGRTRAKAIADLKETERFRLITGIIKEPAKGESA